MLIPLAPFSAQSVTQTFIIESSVLPLLPVLGCRSHCGTLLFSSIHLHIVSRKTNGYFSSPAMCPLFGCSAGIPWASVCLFMERSHSQPSLVSSSVSTPYQQHFVVPASLSGLRICTTSLPDILQPPGYTCTLSALLTNGKPSDFRSGKRPCCCCLNALQGGQEVFEYSWVCHI